ncbi:MAG: MotA/TolQ/ExbB proton channel family protein [Gemmataceae bacterium]|nr:MotA/TolQ/ExbB proton channel family protein [Gemmataceae bacterium]
MSKSPIQQRRSLGPMFVFIVGLPIAWVSIAYLAYGPLLPENLVEYVKHPVEKVELTLFFAATLVLAFKTLKSFASERRAFRGAPVEAWKGQPVPVSEVGQLWTAHTEKPRSFLSTYLGRRIAAVLDFVRSRGSAQGLDDQMRSLSDADAMSLEASYSLLRFVTWAIPILGFLGTVLGITQAISGVTPEVLEKDLSQVTNGLATAFNTTALALFLTMILMFFSFLVERLEQTVLERVDGFVEAELGHRFERMGGDGAASGSLDLVRKQGEAILKATEQLVEKQATVWTRSLEKAERAWQETGQAQQQRVLAALEKGMDTALARHNQRLAELEEKLLQRNQTVVHAIGSLVDVLQKVGQTQREGMDQLTAKMHLQVELLSRLQADEGQILRLQESMQQNLAGLANGGAFEEAVQSLSAAIHLLTGRMGAGAAAPPRITKAA